MPATLNHKLKRLYIIINRLNQQASTSKDLLNLLDQHELGISYATLERDKKTIRGDFGIDLSYDPSDKTYSINTLSHSDVAQALQLLQFHQLSDALSGKMRQGKSSLDFIDFENEYQLKGIEYLDRLFLATKNQQIIEIYHRKFNTSKPVKYKMKPYVLKQYQSRWYVVGDIGHKKIRTLGIDRIESLTLKQDKFNPKIHDLKEKFMGCIGVSHITQKRELIHIKFDISQKDYLDNLPLHQSQTLVEVNANDVVFEYYLVINFELKQQILKYGSMARVLKPKELVADIKNDLKKAYDLY